MRRVLLAIVTTVTGLVMLLSFKTSSLVGASAGAAVVLPSTVTTAPTTVGASPSSTSAGATGSASAPAASAAPMKTTTVTGAAVDTRWGPVQVKITVTNGKIRSAVAVVYPTSNGRDQQINAYAIPILEQETVSARSKSIDMVSGATYTSNGYIASLQSALNKV